MASKYADVVKAAKDLLSKPFGYTNSVEAKVPTKTGSTFTINATVSPSASASVSVASAIGDFKVDKLAVGSDKTVSGEFSYADAFPGTKLTFKASDSSRGAKGGIAAAIGAEVKTKNAFFTADFNAITYGVSASGLCLYEGVLAGASAAVAFADKVDLTHYDGLVGYKGSSFTAALQSTAKLSKLHASYFQDVSADVKVGAIATFPRPGAADSAASVEAGLAYKLSPEAWFTGKVTQAGLVGLQLGQGRREVGVPDGEAIGGHPGWQIGEAVAHLVP